MKTYVVAKPFPHPDREIKVGESITEADLTAAAIPARECFAELVRHGHLVERVEDIPKAGRKKTVLHR